MGFWGKLGKGLLKVAPIAAAFIPGVGPIASMAIGAATNAASKKIEGGSWKSALGAGALGAAAGLGAKGIGPSGSALSKITGKVGGLVGGGATPSGWQGALSQTLKSGMSNLMQPGQPQGQTGQPQQDMYSQQGPIPQGQMYQSEQMPQTQSIFQNQQGQEEPFSITNPRSRRRGLAPTSVGNALMRGASQAQAY